MSEMSQVATNPRFAGGGRPAQDPTAQRAARNLRDKRWDPRHHFHRYMPGEEAQLLADLNANNGWEFFINLPNPADPTLCNCPKGGEVECTFDLDGFGIYIGGDLVSPPDEVNAPNVSFRRFLLEHSSGKAYVRDNNVVVDDIKTLLLTPGPTVAGSVSTTETNTHRDITAHGGNAQREYFRIGGPDLRLVEELERGEQWGASLRLSTASVNIINACDIPCSETSGSASTTR